MPPDAHSARKSRPMISPTDIGLPSPARTALNRLAAGALDPGPVGGMVTAVGASEGAAPPTPVRPAPEEPVPAAVEPRLPPPRVLKLKVGSGLALALASALPMSRLMTTGMEGAPGTGGALGN